MNTDDLQKLCISNDESLITALSKMDEGGEKILFVLDDDARLYGVITDGDIRRWILTTGGVEGQVRDFCNVTPFFVEESYSISDVKKLMLKHKISAIPVVDKKRRVCDFLVWEDILRGRPVSKRMSGIDQPVVIMAGGKGTRPDPFTRVLPKPLLPIGNKPMIEVIIDGFAQQGARHFFISINYKSKIIKSFFEELQPDYTVEYLEEKKPLGTAGGLKQLQDKSFATFIVTNSDTIIKAPYHEVLEYHWKNGNEITIVASLINYNIPYGVCEIQSGGDLVHIVEKPEYNLLVNTGLYVVERSALDVIPEDEFYPFNEFVDDIKKQNRKIGVFPIGKQSWIDAGEMKEFRRMAEEFEERFGQSS